MRTSNAQRIAFIGFGEVGRTFARDLLTREGVTVCAHDRLFHADDGQELARRADALGVKRWMSAAAAARSATIIISAVTASEAEDVAREAGGYLRPGQYFLDVNSAAPATKQRAARHVEAAGAHYIECAVMAPVLKPGLAVPILAGGPMAGEAAVLMNALGMRMTAVAKEHGRASAMKLCRSIVIKGLEALMVDCAAACEGYSVGEQVFASLGETYPSIDWRELAAGMAERVATHGLRRAAEMREAGEMIAALGRDPALALAVADAQQRGAVKKEGQA
jgi:3-hydroxyisobutyrate dehydrogenase-like beta-hydroxyacid dehydrogenase